MDAFKEIERLATERGITRSQAVGALITAALPNAPAELVPPAVQVPATRQAELEREWTRPTFVAQQLKIAIENPTLFGQIYRPREYVMNVLPWRQQAISMFGLPLVLAATRPPNSGCRWCAASRYARRHGLPPVPNTAAARILLGEKCERHGVTPAQRRAKIRGLTAKARTRSAEAQALSRARVEALYWRPLIRTATVTRRDADGRPVRLVTDRDAATDKRRILVRGPDGWEVIQ